MKPSQNLHHTTVAVEDFKVVRLSSRRPMMVVLLLWSGSLFSFWCATFAPLSDVAWWLISIGALAQSIGALIGQLSWKRVLLEDGQLRVSDGFRSEIITLDDLVMIVEGNTLFWEALHVHVNRRTKFGWGVYFVPTAGARRILEHWRAVTFR